MNITAHPVASEELMALVDGELSAEEAHAISTHVDQCADCAKLVKQLDNTSQTLARWHIEMIPPNLQKSVSESAAKKASGAKMGKGSFFIRTSFWTRKQWALASGGVTAVLFLAATILLPTVREMPSLARVDDSGNLPARDTFGPGSVGKFQAETKTRITGPKSQALTLVAPASSEDGHPITDQSAYNAPPAPMIARTVSLSISVKDFAASRSLLESVLARHHGYFAKLSIGTPENAARSLQASLRIPAQELSSSVAELKNFGRVENESQSGEEVTQQHTDLLARLKTSRETERRFQAILQNRPGNVAEVLQVEEGIAQVRGDIERMEAAQNALEHRVNFATVELQLTEEYRAQLNPPAASVSTRIYNGFVAGYHNATETLVGVAVFFAETGPSILIWLGIVAIPAFFFWWRYRRVSTTL